VNLCKLKISISEIILLIWVKEHIFLCWYLFSPVIHSNAMESKISGNEKILKIAWVRYQYPKSSVFALLYRLKITIPQIYLSTMLSPHDVFIDPALFYFSISYTIIWFGNASRISCSKQFQTLSNFFLWFLFSCHCSPNRFLLYFRSFLSLIP
jgi:hypothetical protein